VAFAGTLAVLGDVSRLVMTEGAMTRLQLLWTTRPPPREVLETEDVRPGTLASPRAATAILAHGAEAPATGRSPEAVPASDRLRSGH
jgi:hypothetical protein